MLFYLKRTAHQMVRRTCPQPPTPSPTHHTLKFSFIIIIFIYLSSLELSSSFQFQNDALCTMDNRPLFIPQYPWLDLDLSLYLSLWGCPRCWSTRWRTADIVWSSGWRMTSVRSCLAVTKPESETDRCIRRPTSYFAEKRHLTTLLWRHNKNISFR